MPLTTLRRSGAGRRGHGRRGPGSRGDGPIFGLLAVAVLIETSGIGALYPLLARIQAADHLATTGLGVMSAAAFLGGLVGQVTLARHLDGPRARPLLLGGLVAGAAAQIWFGFGTDLWELTAARALGGVSYGVVLPAALKAGAAGVDPARRGARLGRLSSTQMIGIVVGPLLGAALASAAGLRAPFVTVGALGLVVALLLALLAPQGAEAPRDGEGPEPVVGRPSLTSAPVVAVLLLAVAMQVPNGLYDALWSRLLTDRGATTLVIGLSLAAFGVPYALLAPLGGRLAGRRPLVWAGGGLLVASLFLATYGLVESPTVIIGLGVLEACAQAVAGPGGFAAAAAAWPEQWAATGQGWYSAAGTGAAGLASLAGASLYAVAGPGTVFVLGALVSAGFVAASLAVDRNARPAPVEV